MGHWEGCWGITKAFIFKTMSRVGKFSDKETVPIESCR